MNILTRHQLTVSPVPTELDEQLDALYDALVRLDRVVEVDFTAALATGVVTVDVTVDAEDDLDAMAKSLTALRTAIHELGGVTHGWEHHLGSLRSSVVETVA